MTFSDLGTIASILGLVLSIYQIVIFHKKQK